MFLFSEEDIKKFQQVADTKAELGLDNAILRAFTSEREPPRPINERVELLEFVLMDLEDKFNITIKHIHQENQHLKSYINSLEQRMQRLEEQPKKKRLFGLKN